MSHLFIPFRHSEGNDDLLRLANSWVQAVERDIRGKQAPEILVLGQRGDVLDAVGADATLYILAHGTGMANWIASGGQAVNTLIDARELALRVFSSKLSLRHRVIKLYFCNPNRHAIATFARTFKEEMWQMNYSGALEVYYYEGYVSIPRPDPSGDGTYHKQAIFPNFVTVIDEHGQTRWRASDFRRRA